MKNEEKSDITQGGEREKKRKVEKREKEKGENGEKKKELGGRREGGQLPN